MSVMTNLWKTRPNALRFSLVLSSWSVAWVRNVFLAKYHFLAICPIAPDQNWNGSDHSSGFSGIFQLGQSFCHPCAVISLIVIHRLLTSILGLRKKKRESCNFLALNSQKWFLWSHPYSQLDLNLPILHSCPKGKKIPPKICAWTSCYPWSDPVWNYLWSLHGCHI